MLAHRMSVHLTPLVAATSSRAVLYPFEGVSHHRTDGTQDSWGNCTLPRKAKSVPQNWILIILTTTEALQSKETSVVVAANVYKTSYRLQVAKACRQAMAVTRSIAGSAGSS